MDLVELSIVIPAYNEENRLGKTLKIIKEYCQKFKRYEIIVVNDGSTDKTHHVATKHNVTVINVHPNRGKGHAVKTGMLIAKYKHILFTDSDLSTPIKDLEKLEEYIDDFPIVIGSRNLPSSNRTIKQNFIRRLAGQTYPFFVNIILGVWLKDTQCGFKLFKRGTAQWIFGLSKVDRFGFDSEIMYLAKKYGFEVMEVGVTWENAEGSKVSFVKDSIDMFLTLFKIRRMHNGKKI